MLNQIWYAPIELPVAPEMLGKTQVILILFLFLLVLWVAKIKRQVRRLKIIQKEWQRANNYLNELNENLGNQALQTAEQLQNSEQKFRNMIESLHDECFFYQYDPDGLLSYLSPSISNVLGYSTEQFTQHYRNYLTDHPDNARIDEYTRRGLAGKKVPAYQVEVLASNGKKRCLKIQQHPVYNQHNQCIGLSGIAHDITPIIETQEQLTQLSYYDDLTGLANYRLFTDRVEQMISLSQRQNQSMALLFIDLDGFKLVNDSFGHATGNAALKETANRLKTLLRDSDTAARIGGDEFALILFDSGRDAAKVVAQKILSSLLKPFIINDQKFSIGSSIGIATYPQDGSDSKTLLQQADSAMYYAKNNNKAFAFCTPELDEKSLRRLRLEQALRATLNKKSGWPELNLVYQSKHYLKDNSIQGYEVLIRWQHPELGVISPDEFIPLAEQSGLIVELSHWIITQTALQAIQWKKEGISFCKLAINISPVELINFELAKNIISQIDATGAERAWFEIEITESAVMKMPDISKKAIKELSDAGVLVAIDGFGIGQSSLSYLKKLPATYLKIDRTFIHNIATSPEDKAVIQALISMAHALNKKVIAVGVETAEQLQFLQENDCDLAQGYCFSKPSSPEQVKLYISEIFN